MESMLSIVTGVIVFLFLIGVCIIAIAIIIKKKNTPPTPTPTGGPTPPTPIKTRWKKLWLVVLCAITIAIFQIALWKVAPFSAGVAGIIGFCLVQIPIGFAVVLAFVAFHLFRFNAPAPKWDRIGAWTATVLALILAGIGLWMMFGANVSALVMTYLKLKYLWYALGAVLILILLFTRSGRKSLPWLAGLAMVIVIASCCNNIVQDSLERSKEEWKMRKEQSLLIHTTPEEPLVSQEEQGPKLTLPEKAERLSKPVQVSSEEWRKVPRPDDRYYQFRWCETPRTDILLCVVSNRPPTDTDKDEVFEIGPTEDLSKLPQGPTLWVKTFRTPEGDPSEWTAGFYYTAQ